MRWRRWVPYRRGRPGGTLADDSPFQYVEGEYVHEDELDELLADPNHFTWSNIFPRISTNLAGLGMRLPPLYFLSSTYTLVTAGASLLGAPPIRQALESLLAMADANAAYNAALGQHAQEMAALGYPFGPIAVTIPAFDMVSDFFRVLKGSSLDIYRQPDKPLAAVELMKPASIGGGSWPPR